MLNSKAFIVIFLLLFSFILKAQDLHPIPSEDPKNLLEFFKGGEMEGHVRNFCMSTINKGELKDYYANATGAAFEFNTMKWKGFSFGIKGIFTYNTFSNNLNENDLTANKSAKWEKELFDVLDPEKKNDLDRLEELHITYEYKNQKIKLGKIDIDKTPLINKRDGRMKPFVFRGVFGDFTLKKNHNVITGFIDGVSPRGMTEWFSFQNAIGLSNNGVQPNGEKANYLNKSNSGGVFFIGVNKKHSKNLTSHVWNFHFDNMINVTWLEVNAKYKNWFSGIQYVFEQGMKNQSNLNYSSRYFQPDEKAHVVSTQIGLKKQGLKSSFNYSHVFSSGRFLSPRELGRDRIFTSIPRSWLDGLANVNVYTVKTNFSPISKSKRLSFSQFSTYVDTKNNAKFNKYGIDSYVQLNNTVKYSFEKKMKGLTIELLHVWRGRLSQRPIQPEKEMNTYNFHQINLIANLKF